MCEISFVLNVFVFLGLIISLSHQRMSEGWAQLLLMRVLTQIRQEISEFVFSFPLKLELFYLNDCCANGCVYKCNSKLEYMLKPAKKYMLKLFLVTLSKKKM